MIGFVCALDVEVEGIKEKMDEATLTTVAKNDYDSGRIYGKDVVCCECGVGKVNAAIATQAMIDLFHPSVIVNSGIAGSLSRAVRIGDIVISRDVVQHDIDGTEMGDPPGEIWFNDERRIEIPADAATAARLLTACAVLDDTRAVLGRIATGDTFVAAHERRERIAGMFHADACEMEGGAVGQVCYRNGVPFVVLRCISDDFNENDFMDFVKFRALSAEKSIRVIDAFLKQS